MAEARGPRGGGTDTYIHAEVTGIARRCMYMDAAAPSEAMIMIDVQGRDRKCCTGRRRHYVDGKPRPLFRGVLHGLLSVALAACLLSTSIWNLPAFSLAFAGKFVTYAASATFHLYPFSSVSAVTKAFVADLICVPFSASPCGAIFAGSRRRSRALFAGTVLLFNAVAVLWQTHNQIGLKTRDDRSDAALRGHGNLHHLGIHIHWHRCRF